MRRLPGLLLAALLATTALSAVCAAKPPDLPNDPKITVVAQGTTGAPGYAPSHPVLPYDLVPAQNGGRYREMKFLREDPVPRPFLPTEPDNTLTRELLAALWL